jgi:hypothetical protein
MDLNGPVHANMQSVIKDLESLTKEVISFAVGSDKTDDDKNKMGLLAKLIAKKEAEFVQLMKAYRIRLKKKMFIEELKKVKSVQDKKLEILGTCFHKMYDKLRELERRVETLSDKPKALLDTEDIVRASYLYSKAHSVQAPDKKVHHYRPYPTAEELQKGKLMQIKNKLLASKQQHQIRDPDYIPSANHPVSMESKEAWEKYHQKFCASTMVPSPALEKYFKGISKTEEKKKPKFWTHYRRPYEPIKVAPWNEKALAPQGTIEGIPAYSINNGDLGSSQNGTQRYDTPEYPPNILIPLQEKYSIYFKALTENDEEDLFVNEERLNPLSVQSSDMVQSDNLEYYERFQEITEHERQKYYSSFNEEFIPWLQVPGKEKYKKKPNQRFRLTTPAYFSEQRRIAKRIIWNAKYNRFYRDYKSRLCGSNFTFLHPRRQGDPQISLNQEEYCWNLRKWTMQTTVTTPNA